MKGHKELPKQHGDRLFETDRLKK